MKKRLLFIIFLVFTLWMIYTNITVSKTHITLNYDNLPTSFDGYKIVQVSDFHNAKHINNEKLINMIEKEKPDMIAITGDFIDSYHTDVDFSLEFAKELIKIAPCYYVSGNHEARVKEYVQLKEGLIDLGVIVLENEKIVLNKNNESLLIIGLDDPSFKADYLFGDEMSIIRSTLDNIVKDNFTILLSHRPEYYDIYKDSGVHLVLSGHAHGGQFRIPFIGGVVAPDQGLFPKYDSGVYHDNNFNMVVSRGIGNSIIPIRFNNQPEIVVVELRK